MMFITQNNKRERPRAIVQKTLRGPYGTRWDDYRTLLALTWDGVPKLWGERDQQAFLRDVADVLNERPEESEGKLASIN